MSIEFPEGALAWVPATSTQMMYRIPSELAMGNGKPAWLPVTVRGYEGDASRRLGIYTLDWDSSLILKCSPDIILPRSSRDTMQNLFALDLSKLDVPNDASLLAVLASKFQKEHYYSAIGPNLIHVNPARSQVFASTGAGTGSGGSKSCPSMAEFHISTLVSYLGSLSATVGTSEALSMAQSPHIYSWAVNAIKSMNIEKQSQFLYFIGSSGSGKSEGFKKAAQFLLMANLQQTTSVAAVRQLLSNNPVNACASRNLYEPLGSHANPFISGIGHVAEAVMSSVQYMEWFGNTSSDKVSQCSRHLKQITMHYNSSHLLVGAHAEILCLDPLHFFHSIRDLAVGFSSKSEVVNRPYNIYLMLAAGLLVHFPTLARELEITESLVDQTLGIFKDRLNYYADEFLLFRETVLSTYSLSPSNNTASPGAETTDRDEVKEQPTSPHPATAATAAVKYFNEIVTCLAANLHLQTISFNLGPDVVVFNNSSKHALRAAETCLQVETGALNEYLCKKADDRGLNKMAMVDARPVDAKDNLEILCYEIHSKILAALVKMTGVGEDPSLYSTNHAIFVRLVDTPGWEVPLIGNGNLSHLFVNYIAEIMNGHYVTSSFTVYTRKCLEEGITLNSEEETVAEAEAAFGFYLDTFQKPVGGLISFLEDVCQLPRGDDKAFADKVLTTLTKSKQVRSAGHKAKNTAFIVKHHFGDAAYDAEGFVHANKNRISTAGLALLKSSPLSPIHFGITLTAVDVAVDSSVSTVAVAGAGGGGGGGVSAPPPPPPPPGGRAKPKSLFLDKAAQRAGFVMNKAKDSIQKILEPATGEAINVSCCICIRPNADLSAATLDPSFVNDQLRGASLSPLARLIRSGYPVARRYHDLYNSLRVLLPYHSPSFPLLNDNLRLLSDEKLLRQKTQLLFDQCLTITGLASSVSSPNYIGPVYGKSMVYMKETLASQLSENIERLLESRSLAATAVQASFKMSRQKKRYGAILRRLRSIQSIVRMAIHRKSFRRITSLVRFIKGWWKMRESRKKFRRIKAAAIVIQQQFIRRWTDRVRYRRMRRTVTMLHEMARGVILKMKVDSILRSLRVITRAIWNFACRVRFLRGRLKCTLHIQRLFRGWTWREKNNKLIRALNIRRRQRIAHKVVTSLQSMFRARLVRLRFAVVTRAVQAVQGFLRTVMQRRRFLITRYLALWMQSQVRRYRASKKVDHMRSLLMIAAETQRLNRTRQGELKGLSSSVLNFRVGAEIARSGRISSSFSRFIVGFELFSDLGSYPSGWLRTVVSFTESLRAMEKKSVVKIAVGSEHTVIVDDMWNVYTFGAGDEGQLGHGNRKNASVPRLMETLANAFNEATFTRGIAHKMEVLDVACGRHHTLLLAASGRVYSWGSNRRGQLGHSNFESSSVPRLVGMEGVNLSAGGVVVRNVKQISCGAYSSACVADPGLLYTWGAAQCLGRAISSHVMNKTTNSHTKLGSSSDGSAPLGSTDDSLPDIPPFFQKRRVHSVVSGDCHVTVKSGAEVLTWGSNALGQLGVGDLNDHLLPQRVRLPRFSAVELESAVMKCGGKHMIFQFGSQVWCWGFNKFGQVGNGSTFDQCTPYNIKFPPGLNLTLQFSQVEVGWCYSMVVLMSGKIYAWGTLNLFEDFARIGPKMNRRLSISALSGLSSGETTIGDVGSSSSLPGSTGMASGSNIHTSMTNNGNGNNVNRVFSPTSSGSKESVHTANKVCLQPASVNLSQDLGPFHKLSCFNSNTLSICTIYSNYAGLPNLESTQAHRSNANLALSSPAHPFRSTTGVDVFSPLALSNNNNQANINSTTTGNNGTAPHNDNQSLKTAASNNHNTSKNAINAMSSPGGASIKYHMQPFRCFLNGREKRDVESKRYLGTDTDEISDKFQKTLPKTNGQSSVSDSISLDHMSIAGGSFSRHQHKLKQDSKVARSAEGNKNRIAISTREDIDPDALLHLFTPLSGQGASRVEVNAPNSGRRQTIITSSSPSRQQQQQQKLQPRGVKMPNQDRVLLSKFARKRQMKEMRSLTHIFMDIDTLTKKSSGRVPSPAQKSGGDASDSDVSSASGAGSPAAIHRSPASLTQRVAAAREDRNTILSTPVSVPLMSPTAKTLNSLNSAIDSLRRDIHRMEVEAKNPSPPSRQKQQTGVLPMAAAQMTSRQGGTSSAAAGTIAAVVGAKGAVDSRGKKKSPHVQFSHPRVSLSDDQSVEISKVRDLALVIQNIKKESLEKMSGSWNF